MVNNNVLMIAAAFLLQGCLAAQNTPHTQMSSHNSSAYVQPVVYRTQPVRYVGGPLDNTGRASIQPVPGVQSSYSSASSVQVSSDFSSKFRTMKDRQAAMQKESDEKRRQQILQKREQSINAFLMKYGAEIPGVSDTRMLLKVTIINTSKRMKKLREDLRLAGCNPETDPTYIAIRNKRNKVQANLNALDDKIMNAIVSKSAGNAAETLVVSSDESAEMNAALANLQMAAKQYKDDTEKSIQSANW